MLNQLPTDCDGISAILSTRAPRRIASEPTRVIHHAGWHVGRPNRPPHQPGVALPQPVSTRNLATDWHSYLCMWSKEELYNRLSKYLQFGIFEACFTRYGLRITEQYLNSSFHHYNRKVLFVQMMKDLASRWVNPRRLGVNHPTLGSPFINSIMKYLQIFISSSLVGFILPPISQKDFSWRKLVLILELLFFFVWMS